MRQQLVDSARLLRQLVDSAHRHRQLVALVSQQLVALGKHHLPLDLVHQHLQLALGNLPQPVLVSLQLPVLVRRLLAVDSANQPE